MAANRCDQPIKFILQALEGHVQDNMTKSDFDTYMTMKFKYCFTYDEGTNVGEKVPSRLMTMRQNAEDNYEDKNYNSADANVLRQHDNLMFQENLQDEGKLVDYKYISDYINKMAKTKPAIRAILDNLYGSNKQKKASIYDQIYRASLQCNQPIMYILEELNIQINVFLKSTKKYFLHDITEVDFNIILSNALNNCFRFLLFNFLTRIILSGMQVPIFLALLVLTL